MCVTFKTHDVARNDSWSTSISKWWKTNFISVRAGWYYRVNPKMHLLLQNMFLCTHITSEFWHKVEYLIECTKHKKCLRCSKTHVKVFLSNRIICLSQVKEFENYNIINQFVGIIKCCDQRGDRVSKNKRSFHICSF